MARPVNNQDSYRERLLKNIPSEVLAVYVSAIGIMATGGEDLPIWLQWLMFVLFLAATPLWLVFAQGVRTVWQNVMASVAFVVWAMTFANGPFGTIPGYQEVWGSGFLLLFSGIVAPLVSAAFAKDTPPSR